MHKLEPVRPAPPRLSHPYAQYTGAWPQARSRAQVALAMRQARRRKARRTDREGRGDAEDVGATLLADGVADPLLERLRSQLPLSALGALGSSCRALREELRGELAAAREVLCDGAFALPGPGLPRCVAPRHGWAALALELRALERRVRPRIHGPHSPSKTASCSIRRALLTPPLSPRGRSHAIAAVRPLESGLLVTAGGKGPDMRPKPSIPICKRNTKG